MELNKIKKAAAVQGMTMTSLAKEIGYSRAGFYSAVVNDTIMISSYKKMCERLKVPFGTFAIDVPERDLVAKIDVLIDSIDRLDAKLSKKNEYKHE